MESEDETDEEVEEMPEERYKDKEKQNKGNSLGEIVAFTHNKAKKKMKLKIMNCMHRKTIRRIIMYLGINAV